MNKREKVFQKTQGKCIYCGCSININNFHIEHMQPKSMLKVDKDNINNLFPACVDCNLAKGNLSVEQFRKKIETLIDDKLLGRLIKKYYHLKPIYVKFYFENKEVE